MEWWLRLQSRSARALCGGLRRSPNRRVIIVPAEPQPAALPARGARALCGGPRRSPSRRVIIGPLDLVKQARGLPESWRQALASEISNEYFIRLAFELQTARSKGEVYPPAGEEFAALRLCDFQDVKVVIVGQDPYHAPRQAHGLAFSVSPGVRVPASLHNIYTELERDDAVPFHIPQHGCLNSWAAQGVLLLNSSLTVARGKPNSHKALGWSRFTDAIIQRLNERRDGLVFLLWGRDAQQKCKVVDPHRHDILTAAHPSPLSAHRGFFRCGHFSECNSILASRGISTIRWQLPASEELSPSSPPECAGEG